MHTFRVDWRPSSCTAVKAVSRHSLTRASDDAQAACATFDAEPGACTFSLVTSRSVLARLEAVTTSIVDHVLHVSEGAVKVSRLSLFFREDCTGRLWLLHVGDVAAEGPLPQADMPPTALPRAFDSDELWSPPQPEAELPLLQGTSTVEEQPQQPFHGAAGEAGSRPGSRAGSGVLQAGSAPEALPPGEAEKGVFQGQDSWVRALQARRPTVPIPRASHGMVRLVSNQCPSCGGRLREHTEDTQPVPLLPRKTFLQHYQWLLKRLGRAPFEMSWAQQQQLIGSLDAVRKPEPINHWPPEAESLHAACGVGLYGVFALTVEDDAEWRAKRSMDPEFEPPAPVIRRVPPVLALLHPGLTYMEMSGLRKDPTWLFGLIEVCGACFHSLQPFNASVVAGVTELHNPQAVRGPREAQTPLVQTLTQRLKAELASRKEQRQARLAGLQLIRDKLHRATSESMRRRSAEVRGGAAEEGAGFSLSSMHAMAKDSSQLEHEAEEGGELLGGLVLSRAEARLAAEVLFCESGASAPPDFGGRNKSADVYLGPAEVTEASGGVAPAAAQVAHPLYHLASSMERLAQADKLARTEMKPSGLPSEPDTKAVLSRVQPMLQQGSQALKGQVADFLQYQGAERQLKTAEEDFRDPPQDAVNVVAAGPPATPAGVVAELEVRARTAPAAESRAQSLARTWRSERSRLLRSQHTLTMQETQRARGALLARALGGTVTAQPAGVVMHPAEKHVGPMHVTHAMHPFEFETRFGRGATSQVSEWIKTTAAAGGPDARLASLGTGAVQDPSLAAAAGLKHTKKVLRSPFLVRNTVPAQGSLPAVSFTVVPPTRSVSSRSRARHTVRSMEGGSTAPQSARIALGMGGTWQPRESDSELRFTGPREEAGVEAHESVLPEPSASKSLQPRSEPGASQALGLPPSSPANSLKFKHFEASLDFQDQRRRAALLRSEEAAEEARMEAQIAKAKELSWKAGAGADDLEFRTRSLESIHELRQARERATNADFRSEHAIAQASAAARKLEVEAKVAAFMQQDAAFTAERRLTIDSLVSAEYARIERAEQVESAKKARRRAREEALRSSTTSSLPATRARALAHARTNEALKEMEASLRFAADNLGLQVGEGFTRGPSEFSIQAEKRRRARQVKREQKDMERRMHSGEARGLSSHETLLADAVGGMGLAKPQPGTGVLAAKLHVASVKEFTRDGGDSSSASGELGVWLLVVRRCAIGEYTPSAEQVAIGEASLRVLYEYGAGVGEAAGDSPTLTERLDQGSRRAAESSSSIAIPREHLYNVDRMWGRGLFVLERVNVSTGRVIRDYMTRKELWDEASADDVLRAAKQAELRWEGVVSGSGIDWDGALKKCRVVPPKNPALGDRERAVLPPHPVPMGPWLDKVEDHERRRLRRGMKSAFSHLERRQALHRRVQLGRARLACMASGQDVPPSDLDEELSLHELFARHRASTNEGGRVGREPPPSSSASSRTATRRAGTPGTARWLVKAAQHLRHAAAGMDTTPVDPYLGPSCWPHLSRPRGPEDPAPSLQMLAAFEGPGGVWPSDIARAAEQVQAIPDTMEGIIVWGTFRCLGDFHSVFLRGHASAFPTQGAPFTLFAYTFSNGRSTQVRLTFLDLIQHPIAGRIPPVLQAARTFFLQLALGLPALDAPGALVSKAQVGSVYAIADRKVPRPEDDPDVQALSRHDAFIEVPALFQRGCLASLVCQTKSGTLEYMTLRASEAWPPVLSLRSHVVGARKSSSRELPRYLYQDSSCNPFVESAALHTLYSLGVAMDAMVIAARFIKVAGERWLVGMEVLPPEDPSKLQPLAADSERLAAHFIVSDPSRAVSPRSGNGYAVETTIKEKAELDGALPCFRVFVMQLDTSGWWDETGCCLLPADCSAASEDDSAERLSSTILSFGQAASARRNPLLEHVATERPPLAVSTKKVHKSMDAEYFMESGALTNADELTRQAAAKAAMMKSMALADAERRAKGRKNSQLEALVDTAVGTAALRLGERPSLSLSSVFSEQSHFSG